MAKCTDPIYQTASGLLLSQSRLLRLKPVLTETEIHDLRVVIKRARALLRLYRNSAEQEDLALVDDVLRDVARQFAGHRDAQVQNRLLPSLADEAGLADAQLEALLDELPIGVDAEADHYPSHLLCSANLLLVIDSWKTSIRQPTADFISAGLKRTYQKASYLGDEATHAGDPACFHKWRRWTKYHLYQVSLLSDHGLVRVEKAYIKRLKKLGECLGDWHDLDLLREKLAEFDEDSAVGGAVHALSVPLTTHLEQAISKCAALRDEIFSDRRFSVALKRQR